MAAFETTPVAIPRADQPTIVLRFIATSERFLFYPPAAAPVRLGAPFRCAGDHPGSSYYAAELQDEIVNANQAAHALGLAFRFRAEGGDVVADSAASTVVTFSQKAGV